MKTRLGIDEAGRGCVLGPLVFGACLVNADQEKRLKDAGFRDSKKLSAKKRAALREEAVGMTDVVLEHRLRRGRSRAPVAEVLNDEMRHTLAATAAAAAAAALFFSPLR